MHSKVAFVEKTYKWEDLEIIREDCWNSGRLHLKGIVFSSSTTLQLFHKKNIVQDFLMYNEFDPKHYKGK